MAPLHDSAEPKTATGTMHGELDECHQGVSGGDGLRVERAARQAGTGLTASSSAARRSGWRSSRSFDRTSATSVRGKVQGRRQLVAEQAVSVRAARLLGV